MFVNTTWFSGDYASARSRFRAAANEIGWVLESHSIDRKGPNGEDLTIDVAMSPGIKKSPTLLVSSGIHGAEGFFGAAVQLGTLHQWASLFKHDSSAIRCVMLHAVNPFGFAWGRRVNEENVDLNRNLLQTGDAFSGSPAGYTDLDALLNPRRVPSRWEPVRFKIMMAIIRYGMPALKQAVASGQYDYPKGLFYGGNKPSRTSEILNEHIDRWLDDSESVFHLDLHTGLGRWGSYRLLIDHPLSTPQQDWSNCHFGANSFESCSAEGTAYATRGSFGLWGSARLKSRSYLYAAAEFGTYKAPVVLAALRAENQCYHWGRKEDRATVQAKEQLLEVFCPRSNSWRSHVLDEGIQLVGRAANSLVNDRTPCACERTSN